MAQPGDSRSPPVILRHRRSIKQLTKLTPPSSKLITWLESADIARGPPFTCLRGASWVWPGSRPAGGAAVDLGLIWVCSGGSGVRIPARQTNILQICPVYSAQKKLFLLLLLFSSKSPIACSRDVGYATPLGCCMGCSTCHI